MLRLYKLILLIGLPAATGFAADLPDGKGKELVLRSCVGCHKADSFSSYQHTKEEYSAIAVRMAARGAAANAEEQEIIAAYLAKNFPKLEDPNKINVNKATAKEIESGLGLTEKEALAVVSYRDRHGNFHAVGDLYIIYGVDGAKIEAQKEKIGF
jgi:competence protein ComEA